jgi:peptidoglycan/LPS O-acetylase OafA/YrhL
LICVLIKKVSPVFGGPHNFEKYTLNQLLYLNTSTLSHLWTIPCEVKYYFFIPFFVICSKKMKKNLITKIAWILLLTFLLFIAEKFRLIVDFDKNGSFTRENHEFLTRFTTFYLGSVLAFIVHLINSNEVLKKIKNNKIFRFLCGAISMALYVKGMVRFSRYYNKDLRLDMDFFNASLYWFVFLFVFIVGSPNFFTRFFKIGLFDYGGKFSYGIYLYHMMVIDYLYRNYRKTVKLQFEIVVYCFLCVFLIGFLFYYLVEKNLIRIANLICSFISRF